MFTGIVEKVVPVKRIEKNERGLRFQIEYENNSEPLQPGESVAINGVCLTIASTENKKFWVETVHETLNVTALAQLKEGDCVNFERSLKVGGRIGGHFVFGHVDGVADVQKVERAPDSHVLIISIPTGCESLIVEKGSVAIDGVSLTIQKVLADSFTVAVIPYTAQVTTLGAKKAGSSVNVETDMLAKYVLRAHSRDALFPFTAHSLEELGF